MGIARGKLWASLILAFITACSGGETGTGLSDSGAGNTTDGNNSGNNPDSSKVVIGTLSNIGSNAVVVNGSTYNTGTSSIVVGNTSGSESDLAVGMVVAIDVNTDEASHQSTATVIAFENEVEGIVLANDYPDSLDVMGQVVLVNNDTVFESHVSSVASIQDIRKKDHVEISGYPTEDGAIYATHVVVKADTASDNQIIVKGNVASLSTFEHQFNLGSLTVTYLDSSLAGGLTALKNDMPVKVIGHVGFKGNNNEVLFAEQIFPLVNSGFRFEGTQIEIEGMVATDLQIDTFTICHLNVRVSDVTSVIGGDLPEIMRGRLLKVSGVIDDQNHLIADAIVFMRQSSIAVTGAIESIDTEKSSINVFGKTFYVNSSTLMKISEQRSHGGLIALSDYTVGTVVEIKAYRDSASMDYVATRIEAENGAQGKIQGQIDDIQSNLLIMKNFVIDISGLPPGQFKATDIGSRVELSVDYSPADEALIATGYEYEN